MKKITYKLKLFLIAVTGIATLYSCDETGDTDPGGTTTENFAGDWHIIGYEPDGVTPVGDYVLYSTYNAASNDENFWIDDHNTYFQLKSKVQVSSFSSYTFAGQAASEELYTGGTVTVTNGKILKKAATSFGGHEVDSIYFEAEFDWDPGVVYKFSGHKRTGFLEDEL